MTIIARKEREFQKFKSIFMEFITLRSLEFLQKKEPALLEDLFLGIYDQIRPASSEIKKRFGLTDKAMTMADVRRICKAENILFSTTKPKGIKKNVLGQYTPHRREIWIDGKLSCRHRRFIAAHEISHHFLHGAAILSGTLNYSNMPEQFSTEMEADLCASFLLSCF